MTLQLRNPHSVRAALLTRASDVEEVVLGAEPGEAWASVAQEAQALGIALREGTSTKGGRRGSARAGAAYATVKERAPAVLAELLAEVGPRDLFLALDQIQDPQNVGAIFRLASFFGVRGVVMTRDRAAPLSSVAYDVASGGVETVPFVAASNLRRALDAMREAGVWVLGTTEHAERVLDDVPRDRAWVVVLGNEEHGLRRLTLEACDETCRIPAQSDAPAVGSLNVSVAAGICLAALRR
ncbi:MAG: RNA methyltransferase [Chloroflexi bacterium]|nr:RNA methyltransferase [Chloroflexota bacterium]MCZ6707099.1 RNA methyltransferase [Chloroflexota bacterium]